MYVSVCCVAVNVPLIRGKKEEGKRRKGQNKGENKKNTLSKESTSASASASARSKFPCNWFFSFSCTLFYFQSEHPRFTSGDGATGETRAVKERKNGKGKERVSVAF